MDIDDWVAQTFLWVGPAFLRANHGGDPKVGPICKIQGELRPLLEVGALRCFWTMPKTILMHICKHLGSPLVLPTATLFEVLRALISDILKPSAECLADILAQRVVVDDAYAEFMRDEDATDLLAKSE